VNPLTYAPGDLADKDLGDLAGDLLFEMSVYMNVFACSVQPVPPGVICDNSEVAGDDIGVTRVVVEVDTNWGPYATCNICVNGTSPLNHSHTCEPTEYVCDCETNDFPPDKVPCTKGVGWQNTSAFLGSEGVGKFCRFSKGPGQVTTCAVGTAADKLQGIWFSTLAHGECTAAGTPAGCTWRLLSVDKRVQKNCHSDVFLDVVEAHDQSGCFDACGQPRNTSSLCWAGCFVDTTLGSPARNSTSATQLGMRAAELMDAWNRPFESDDPAKGGCPNI